MLQKNNLAYEFTAYDRDYTFPTNKDYIFTSYMHATVCLRIDSLTQVFYILYFLLNATHPVAKLWRDILKSLTVNYKWEKKMIPCSIIAAKWFHFKKRKETNETIKTHHDPSDQVTMSKRDMYCTRAFV